MNRQTVSTQVLLSIACASTTCFASNIPRVMMHPDGDLVVTISTSAHIPATPIQTYQPAKALLPLDQLAQLRIQGADIDLIDTSNTTTEFSYSSDGYTSTINPDHAVQLLNSNNGQRSSTNKNMQFTIGRSTTLSDGNISGAGPSLPGNTDSVATMTQSEGEYNFYEMGVEWKAASAGPVDFSFSSGLTAIEANVSKQVTTNGSSNIYDVSHKVIAVPTIGSSVKWNISRNWSLTGQATTQSLNMGSSLMGFNAQTDWRISDRVGLVAGYQILRSEFDLGAVTTDLNQEGLFARLSIKF